MKGIALCRFIEEGSRVPVTISQAMWPSLSEQKSCYFRIREDENIDVGTANNEIAVFLVTQEKSSHPE